MAGEHGRGCRSYQTVAVIFILCSLAWRSTCLSWQGLSNEAEQKKAVSEATMAEVRTGSILFGGKLLQSESGSTFATATENDELPHAYPDQPDSTEFLALPSLLEDNMSNDAAWQQLNPSLQCSQETMKFTITGSGTDDLQLDMGNAGPLPLEQVPDSCGYSVQQNAKGLILEVFYDGCNVIEKNGNYTLPMIWKETPFELTCAISIISATSTPPVTTAPNSPAMPEKLPFPFRPQLMTRRKRQTTQPLPISDPRSPYYAYWYYYYYLNGLAAPTTAVPTTAAPTTAVPTTAAPTTTMTTNPPETTTTTKPPTANLPVYPYYPIYPYYPYPYYPHYHLPRPPVSTPKPVTTTTTAKPTTSMPSTTSKMTTKPSDIKNPPKTPQPIYMPYPYLPHLPPPGIPLPQMPENSEVYYYPVIQHFYGKHPNMPTAKPPTKPSDPTTQSKPVYTIGKPVPTPGPSTPTTKPTTKQTMKPTTASTAPTTPKVQTTSSGKYPGPMSPFVPYNQRPFPLYVQYRSKAGYLPFDQKMPYPAFKSGAEPRANLHPGFNYWQPGPWFSESTGQGNPQFDWKNFQPEEN